MPRPLIVALFALAALLGLPAAASAESEPVKRYIIGYERSAGTVDRETDERERAEDFDARFRYRAALEGFAADLTARQVTELRTDPEVAFIEPDRPVKAYGAAALAAGDSVPFGMRRIGAATATTVGGAADGAVAIIDSGIDLTAPELEVEAGTDCTGSGSANDGNGHGTHVAGVVGARNDGRGVVGVAPGTRVIAVKVLGAMGEGSISQVICGIDWVTANATARNIKVANLSAGGRDYSGIGTCETNPLRRAICRSTAGGVTYVAAAGNDGRDFGAFPPDVPASYPEVLTVTAFSDTDGLAGGRSPLSCDGSQVDDRAASFSSYATVEAQAAHTIAAPGVCVPSLVTGGGTSLRSGTSMASPHVAGAVALCRGSGGVAGPCAGLAPAQVIARLRADAAAPGATFGFQGDPLAPIAREGGGNRFYGSALRVIGGPASPRQARSPRASAPTSKTGQRYSSASRACRTWRARKSTAKRRLAAAKRAAASLPTVARRERVRRASTKVTKASRQAARRCRSAAA